MFIMATDIDRKAFQSTVTNPFVRGVDILDDLAGDFRAALRGFNRGFNTLNPLHRITSIGEYYVPSGGAGSKKKRKRGNESADPKVMSNGALAG